MGVMFDAVNPANIPAEADGRPVLLITVLAHPQGQAFDVEAGNAPAPAAAAAMRARHDEGKWSVGYVNESTFHDLTAAMGPQGLTWTDASQWPAPGVYLWAADPDGNIAAGRWQVPVKPLAVQDGFHGTDDSSTTVDNFPAAAAGYIDGQESVWPAAAWSRFTLLPDDTTPPPPAPPTPPTPPAPPAHPSEVDVRLPILTQGASGPSVKVVQKLIGNLATDGLFGPLTHEAVITYQSQHGLQADGVVGAHTWGTLLGAPQ